MLRFQLYSAQYTVLQTKKNSTRSTSTINPVTTENMDDSHYKRREAITCYHESTDTLLYKQKEMGHKSKSLMRALCTLMYVKRHLSG